MTKNKIKKPISGKTLKELLAPITQLILGLVGPHNDYQEVVNEVYLYEEFFSNNESTYSNATLPSKTVMVKEVMKQMTPKLEQLANNCIEQIITEFEYFELSHDQKDLLKKAYYISL